MAVDLQRPPKTLEDYRSLSDEDRTELLRGDFYVTPPPTAPHQDVVLRLVLVLAPHVESRGAGRVCLSPEVALPSGDVVAPDLLFVRRERLGIVGDVVAGAPDVVIEVVSPSHPERDRIVKRVLYAENGVSEYWVVEPEARAVQVLRLEGGAYVPAGWFTAGSVLTSRAFPDLRLDVAGLFRA
jgi:Uma2 family endonuclease